MFSHYATAASELSSAAVFYRAGNFEPARHGLKHRKPSRSTARPAKGRDTAMTVCDRISRQRVAISDVNFACTPGDHASVSKLKRALTRRDGLAPVFVVRLHGELRAEIGDCLVAAADELGHEAIDAVVFDAATSEEADAVSELLSDLDHIGEAVCEELALIAGGEARDGFIGRLLNAAPLDAAAQLASARQALRGAKRVQATPVNRVENGVAWFTLSGEVDGARRMISQVIPSRVCRALQKRGVSLERYQAGLLGLFAA